MRKTIIAALLLISSIGAGFAAIEGFAGKWFGTVLMPNGNTSKVTYIFKEDGDKLTGTAENAYGTEPIENGKISGKDITFSINIQGMDLQHKGKLYTDSVALDIDYNGSPLHVNLKRAEK